MNVYSRHVQGEYRLFVGLTICAVPWDPKDLETLVY